MTRAELKRCLHAVRVEAYALALFDTGPRPVNYEMALRFRKDYREIAERRVTESEAMGRFTTDIERVA